MKRLKRWLTVLAVSAIAIGGTFSFGGGSASAMESEWLNVNHSTGCKVQLLTDYNSYTKTATSVDIKLRTNGNCTEKIYYTAYLINDLDIAKDVRTTGYFQWETPWKPLNIDQTGLTKTGTLRVKVSLYGNEAKTHYIRAISIEDIPVQR